ncbi:hypothetical protein [Paraburkholderia sp. J7]|uniref:hypothetical protein n=1 Tax=Paraburkholderia sp. J7 TaxID=2805438 RepID=UPI002AB7F0DC|nr:hypothetical protein [Paraburkholderia sp. J7]
MEHNGDETIDGIVRRHLDRAGREHELHFWQHTLNYLIKVLLYLSTGTAAMRADNAWSAAPRELKGLGKRKRAERLASIDRLYDRYIIGPEVLPTHPDDAGTSTGTHEQDGGRAPDALAARTFPRTTTWTRQQPAQGDLCHAVDRARRPAWFGARCEWRRLTIARTASLSGCGFVA